MTTKIKDREHKKDRPYQHEKGEDDELSRSEISDQEYGTPKRFRSRAGRHLSVIEDPTEFPEEPSTESPVVVKRINLSYFDIDTSVQNKNPDFQQPIFELEYQEQESEITDHVSEVSDIPENDMRRYSRTSKRRASDHVPKHGDGYLRDGIHRQRSGGQVMHVKSPRIRSPRRARENSRGGERPAFRRRRRSRSPQSPLSPRSPASPTSPRSPRTPRSPRKVSQTDSPEVSGLSFASLSISLSSKLNGKGKTPPQGQLTSSILPTDASESSIQETNSRGSGPRTRRTMLGLPRIQTVEDEPKYSNYFKFSLDDKGFPLQKNQILGVFLPGGRYMTYPCGYGNEILSEVLKKICMMVPRMSLSPTNRLLDIDDNPVDVSKTLEELQIHRVFFGTTCKEWKQEYQEKGNDLGNSPRGISPRTELRVQLFRIYLPHGQLKNVFWDAEKSLQQVLDDVCLKMNISQEGKTPCDMQGNQLDTRLKLSELGTSTITFGTSLCEWNANSEDRGASNNYVEQDSDSLVLSPRSPDRSSVMLMTQRDPKLNGGRVDMQVLLITLPTKETSKAPWVGYKKLEDILSKTMKNRGLRWEDYEARDRDNNKLDSNKTLEELGIYQCQIKEKEKELFYIYLPQGVKSSTTYVPDKKLSDVLQSLLEARPQLQVESFKPTDISGLPIDPSTMLCDIMERSVYYGTTFKEWKEFTSKTNNSLKRQTSTHKAVRKVAKARAEIKLDILPGNLKRTESKTMPTEFFKIYLSNVQSLKSVYKPEVELGVILEKIKRSDLSQEVPRDIEGNELDRKKKIGELGVMEIAYGTEMMEWTLGKAQDFLDYFKAEQGDDPNNNVFKIYLPDASLSSVEYEKKKHLTLEEVLNSKLISGRINQILPKDTHPIDVRGTPVDIHATLDNLDMREVWVGTDLLDWWMIYENQQNLQQKPSDVSPIQRRLLFLEELDKKYGSTFVAESARGVRKEFLTNSKDMRNRNNVSGSPKSPARHKRPVKPPTRPSGTFPNPLSKTPPVDITQMLQKLNRDNSMDDNDDYWMAGSAVLWHSQNSSLNDYEHYLHFVEEESNYKSNHMVPYHFLEQPRYKKHYFHQLNSQGRGAKKTDLVEPFKDYTKGDGPGGVGGYDEWLAEMEDKVVKKHQEHQEVSVSFLGDFVAQQQTGIV